MNAPTAENALEDMKISQALYLTKDGKFYSTIANEYKAILQSYSVYCKEEKQELIEYIAQNYEDKETGIAPDRPVAGGGHGTDLGTSAGRSSIFQRD